MTSYFIMTNCLFVINQYFILYCVLISIFENKYMYLLQIVENIVLKNKTSFKTIFKLTWAEGSSELLS